MNKYAKKAYFRKVTAKKCNKSFWNAIKPFFTNRGIITNDSITLEEKGVLKNDPKETAKVFNKYYINVVETTFEKRPSSFGNPNSQSQDRATVKKVIEYYKNHPSVATITENILPDSLSFDLPPASKKDINKIIKPLSANKAAGPDGIPFKLIKLFAVDKYLTSIISHDTS